MQTNNAANSAAFGIGPTLNHQSQALNLLQQQTQNLLASQNQLNQSNLIQTVPQQQQVTVQQKDTTFTKIFVGGLPYHTTDESLKSFFQRFGNIDEAVVITDRSTGKSRGYGFVTMETKEGAEAALVDPNPIIDGRKANVNLAYLGVKSRIVQPTNFIPLTLARFPIPATTPNYGIHQIYYHQLASATSHPTIQLTTAPNNLLLQTSGLSTNTPFTPLSSTANNNLFDLNTNVYNNGLQGSSNRASPFDASNHLAGVTGANQFLQFNTALTSNSTNQNSLNSMLAAQAAASYFAITPQNLSYQTN